MSYLLFIFFAITIIIEGCFFAIIMIVLEDIREEINKLDIK